MDRSPLTNLLMPPRYLKVTAASAFFALAMVTGCETNQATSSDGGHDAMVAESTATHASAHHTSATRDVTGIAAGWDGMEALSADAASWAPDVARIINTGKNHNQVMMHLFHLTNGIGPRLTGSTRAFAANNWAADQFRSWGLQNVQVKQWGTIPLGFDRDLTASAKIVSPFERTMEFTWPSWGAGTDGPVRAKIIKEPTTAEEFEAVRDQLEGVFILQQARKGGGRRGVAPTDPSGAFRSDYLEQCREAGILGVIRPSILKRPELVRTGGWGQRRTKQTWRNLTYETIPKEIAIQIRREDYDAINSRLSDGDEVEVELNLACEFIEGPVPCYNTIAEIPGTVWPEQVVIVSAHLDSWDGPGSQGSCDNGTGSSVTLEAARLLATSGVKPKRTIRFVLWTGEEQGLLGSKAYVASLSDEEKANISAVFVDDGGTNYEGGLGGLAAMVPMLQGATIPVSIAFPDMPVNVREIENLPKWGASDHASFTAVGIPGFFWDEIGRADYTFAWHTQNDRYEQGIQEYLVQSSTCAAVTAFNLANADTMLPRKNPDPPAEEATEEADESDG